MTEEINAEITAAVESVSMGTLSDDVTEGFKMFSANCIEFTRFTF
jgi:hypothetical protein